MHKVWLEQHLEKYEKALHVHRLVPGSSYTLEGSTTLCYQCHGPQPRAHSSGRLIVNIPSEHHAAVRLAVIMRRTTMNELLSELIATTFAKEIADIQAHSDKKKRQSPLPDVPES